jgi:hypothetical protein
MASIPASPTTRSVRCEGHYAKTASRSLLGVMNEFTFLGNVHREDRGADDDLVALSVAWRRPR